MSETYKITAVSEKIKNWSSQHGDFTTYFVRLDGQGDEAVQVNKKSSSTAPKVGDEIYGELTSTEYGIKFKSVTKPFGTDTKPSESNDTQDSISRSVALKAAVDYWNSVLTHTKSDATSQAVLEIADDFLVWLKDETKTAPKEAEQPDEQWTGDIPPEFN